MADSKKSDYSEKETAKRRDDALRRAMETPPTTHKPKDTNKKQLLSNKKPSIPSPQ